MENTWGSFYMLFYVAKSDFGELLYYVSEHNKKKRRDSAKT